MNQVKRIMLVDDSEAEHIIAQVAIEEFDETVSLVSAYDGQEAIEYLRGSDAHPDIIFVDINMPRMNGIEFLEAFSGFFQGSSVVAMLSSSSQPSDKETCMKYPFVKKYITKPLEVSDIVELSKQAMN